MTIMFYMINLAKDSEGVRLLYEVNHKFKVLTSVKSYIGSQEGIELHKGISELMEKITLKCIDLLVTKTITKMHIMEFVKILFLRSGLFKDVSTSRV